jgi:hypothetical protein
MIRREFTTLLGAAIAWPLAAWLIVAALVAAIPALAHSWYPLACCGNMDCFPVACDQLVETGSGWFYVPTGNLFKREQVQPSQDHHCHGPESLRTGAEAAYSGRRVFNTRSRKRAGSRSHLTAFDEPGSR